MYDHIAKWKGIVVCLVSAPTRPRHTDACLLRAGAVECDLEVLESIDELHDDLYSGNSYRLIGCMVVFVDIEFKGVVVGEEESIVLSGRCIGRIVGSLLGFGLQ